MSGKLIKIIIAVVVVIIILILALIFLLTRSDNDKKIASPGKQDDETIEIREEVERVKVRNDYYAVKTCVNKFYLYYMSMYTSNDDVYIIDEEAQASLNEEQEENVTALYNILDEEYIKANQITEENLKSELEQINESTINITNMYVSQKTENMYVYIIEGTIREKSSGTISNFKIIIKLDALNRTFTVLPQDYVEKNYTDIIEGEKIEINVPEEIEKNYNNQYDYNSITDVEYVEDLMSKFKEEVLYNPELAYESINAEYKAKKFENLDEFKNYAKNNTKKHVIAKVDKYQKTSTDEYTQYVLLDTKGNYYIFRETAPMYYTLILDTYTIDIPEFLEKYEGATDQEKVILNLNKFMLALNDGDYKYVYNVLADSFKQNYFSDYSVFEQYMETVFFEENEFDYVTFGNEGGTYYTYTVNITDASGENANVITKTFVMILEDGTDFEMSFNV